MTAPNPPGGSTPAPPANGPNAPASGGQAGHHNTAPGQQAGQGTSTPPANGGQGGAPGQGDGHHGQQQHQQTGQHSDQHQPGQQGDPDALGDAGQRALAAERQRARDAEKRSRELQTQLDAINQQNMSELERANARAAEFERRFTDAEAQRLRFQIATQHQISNDDMVLLTGTTEDELTAQAARLSALNAGRAAATAPPAFAPNPGQQAGNGAPPQTATVEAGRAIYRRKHGNPTA